MCVCVRERERGGRKRETQKRERESGSEDKREKLKGENEYSSISRALCTYKQSVFDRSARHDHSDGSGA